MKSIIKYIDFFRLLTIRDTYGFPYHNLSVLGIFIFIISLSTLHRSFIPLNTCVIITSISSIIVTTTFWKFYSKNLNIIWALIHNLGIGLIVLAIFIETNNFFTTSNIEYKTYKITNLRHKEIGKNRGLTLKVDINIENQQKTFSLSNRDSKKVLGTINNWKVKVGLQKDSWDIQLLNLLKHWINLKFLLFLHKYLYKYL